MQKSLSIADGLNLPLESVSRSFGILAMRGAGKSNAAAVMAEQMFAAALPFVVIDPVGSWYGLRSSSDGTGPGLPIPIFGGKHGDLPLDRAAGVVMADLIVSKRLSCVIDLSEFESEAAKKQFLLEFAQQLYRKNEDPLHLFLEEADDYIAQRPMRDEARLLRAWENIVRRGRSRGLGITLITQRSAAINKMVLTQVETLFALRTTGPQDIQTIKAWVQYHQVGDEVISSLSSLPDGDAWVWSPQFLGIMKRVHIRRRATFDSGATPKNFTGSHDKPAATLADVNMAEIEKQMAATIERAKADDPAALRRQVRALQAEVSALQTVRSTSEEVDKLRQEFSQERAVSADEIQKLRERIGQSAAIVLKLKQQLLDYFGTVEADLAQAAEEATIRPPLYVHESNPAIRPHGMIVSRSEAAKIPNGRYVVPIPASAARFVGSSAKAQDMAQGEKRVLQATAQYPAGVTRQQLSILTGYKRSTRDLYLQKLLQRSLIERDGDRIRSTPAGTRALGRDFEPLPTGRALIEHWRGVLPVGEEKVFSVIVSHRGTPVNRDHISEQTGYLRSTRDLYIQKLTTRQLIINHGRGMVSAAPFLFE